MRFLPIYAVAAAFSLTACNRLLPRPVDTGAAPAAAPAPTPAPAAQPSPPPRKPHAPPAPTPIVLTGLTRTETASMLGEPAARTERNPGETWVYRAPGCEVEVLFLLDLQRNDYFAVDSHVTAGGASPEGEQTCLHRIKRDHDK
jgi:hypothetical protein